MALYFPTNAYGLLGTGSINHGIGTGEFTWCAWIKMNAAADGNGHTIGMCSDLNNGGLMARGIGSNNWGLYWGGDYSFGTTLAAGRWYHLLATRRANTLYGYLDGVESASTFALTKNMGSGTAYLGSDSGGSFRLQGTVAHVGLFASSCGAAQAQRIAKGTPAVEVLRMVRFWCSLELGDVSGRAKDDGPARVQLKSLFASAGNYPTWIGDDAKFSRLAREPHKYTAAAAVAAGSIIGSGFGGGTLIAG